MTTLRQAIFGKVKSSAQGLARKSKDKLSPVWNRSSNVFKFRPRRTRAPLTSRQRERRRRRRDNTTKICRMLQRINQDPFVASRVVQAISALFLLLGERLLAACTSFISVLILHQTTQLASTKHLQAWYYVGVVTLAVSVGSTLLLDVLEPNSAILLVLANHQAAGHCWWGQAVPLLWGFFVSLWLYQDIESSRDGCENSIETIEFELSLLQARYMVESSSWSSKSRQWKNSVIVVQHGPIVLGNVEMRQLFEDGETSATASCSFRSTAFSHFIESSKGSFLHCRVKGDPK